ncbi:DUF11 domain-containing protein [Labedella populi]|uniref:DUF11 domain-containing protein n=1 Tax=Labedella populi TaxID=2498850 RepID=A0A444QFE1_9MICO|nr:DUF5979 domain-containing protein [Labedella populi]RWZ68291.1 DUF11 domain-containing protein [Labedella populi]
MSVPYPRRQRTRAHVSSLRQSRSAFTAAMAIVLAVIGGGLTASPAFAAIAALSITKTVEGGDAASFIPGDEFSYTITVGCDDEDCVDAELVDPLPTELAGFEILSTSVEPPSQAAALELRGCADVVTEECILAVEFRQSLADGVGIRAGATYQVSLTLKVPQDLQPTWSSNGDTIVNTATALAATADTVSDPASIVVTIATDVDVDVDKAWEPSSQQFEPGASSTVSLGIRNASNISAGSLTLQEPGSADAGEAALASDNPFRIVDLAGLGAVTAPEGADRITVDAFVYDAGSWNWVVGGETPVGEAALPAGVDPAAVGGLRFTFSATDGSTIVAVGGAGSVEMNVVQRATDRETGASLVLGADVVNVVAGTVLPVTGEPVTATAEAAYEIGSLDVEVMATKSINPERVPAGSSATASIGARNDSNGVLTRLVLADEGYFTPDVMFGGFSGPLALPAGATRATVTWTYSDGSTVDAAVGPGTAPSPSDAPAAEHLTGFSIAYTGAIEAGATVAADFEIAIRESAVPEKESGPLETVNTLVATGENAAGTATAEAEAPLDVFFPDIRLVLDKTISPSGAVAAGGTVVVQTPVATSTDSAFVTPTSIVVDDVWREGRESDFWNAFTPLAIAPTQVPVGSTLTVSFSTDGGATWQTLTDVDATAGTRVVSGSLADLASANGVDLNVELVTGLRYSFRDGVGFAAGTTVSPNTVFQARSTLRGSPDTATSIADADPSVYENRAFAVAEGAVDGGSVVRSDEVDDVAVGSIVSFDGVGSVLANKRFTVPGGSANLDFVNAQSGERAGTLLAWGVTATGYDSVVVSDAAGNETSPQDTVFQAFDLTRIAPVTFQRDPLLRWDTVSAVDLFIDGAWQRVPAPGGNWMNGSGFVGYILSASERAATTGVRITVVPNDAARESSSDPLAPPVGSGVATSTATGVRPLDLVWTLRNVVRVEDAAGRWVTSEHGYNDEDPATVWNSMSVGGVQGGSPVEPRTARDSLTIIDQAPLVSVRKSSNTTMIPVPFAGDVAPSDYPTLDFTITATNDSSARAPYIRVTDPMPCVDTAQQDCLAGPGEWDADPFDGLPYEPDDNPFEMLTITHLGFSIANAGVDPAASTVALRRLAADGSLSTSLVSVTAAEALTPAQLADVVGVSVLYQGTSPETTGGTIVTGAPLTLVLTAQLRVTERSDASIPVEPFVVANYAFVQGHDPVLAEDGAPYDSDTDGFDLVGGRLDVTAQKTIAPDALLEKNRAEPVSVLLRATGGASTVATNRVVISDTDAGFWSRFALSSLGSVTLPAGSDRVRVDVRTGADEWVEGVPAAAAALPALDVADVTGIRFVFTRADGGVFSHTAPPAGWTATAALTVRLLDTVRGSGEEIPFPSVIDNAIDVVSERTDDPEIYASAAAEASDTIALETGTYQLDVEKSPAGNMHTVSPGESTPWTLEFTNTGSGFLTVDEFVDTLPAELSFDQVPPVYEASEGGTLPMEVEHRYDAATHQLSFSWPDGSRMRPGETFRITVGLVLEPGLQVGQRTTNRFVVTTAQELSACTNTSGNGQGVLTGSAATECGTSNFVQPTPGASLATYKGVKGEIDGDLVSGAVNVQSPATECVPDRDGYVQTPCAALTALGATDEWKLQVVNSGTEGYSRVTLVDPLPAPGDRMLATGGSRASTFRPVFDSAFGVEARTIPAGATLVWSVTTDAAPCVGTGTTTWPSDPTCEANAWVPSADFAGDWADVTALRADVDFAASPSGVMTPGQTLQLAYRTVNVPASAEEPEAAPIDVPVVDDVAWNQFGAFASLAGGGTLQRAPVKAGVTLLGGPLEIEKVVDGPGSGYAPDSFRVDVSCVVGGAAVDMGTNAEVTLDESGSYRHRIDGIPLGADCTVEEDGEVGEFGESARVGSPSAVSILQSQGEDGAVPAGQAVTITNVYELGGISITKAVDTAATVGSFGPFGVTVECVTALGDPVALDPSDSEFVLEAGATRTITDAIPLGSRCTVSETNAGGADATTMSGGTVVDGGDGSAVLTVDGEADGVLITNTFAAGTLSVLKTVLGDGAADYGDGPFAASVSCNYGGEVVYSIDDLPLVPDEAVRVDAVLPVGTVCDVAEVATGGATEHEESAAVVITGPADGETVGAVTAVITNAFHTSGLDVVKERTGDGVEEFGDGPFGILVSCTWVKDGATLTIPVVDGGVLSLSEENGFAAGIDGIIVGASCAVEETDPGLAVESRMTPTDGTVTIADAESERATVVVRNRFDVGQLAIEKTVQTATVAPGDDVRYVITVRNTGQIDAANLRVEDVLPVGATFRSAAPEGLLDGRTLSWIVDELAAGQSTTIDVVVSYEAPGTYVNHAAVSNGLGPWRPVEVVAGCEGGDACATVAVAVLAVTGRAERSLLFLLGTMALGLGFLAVVAARRRYSRR